MKIVVVVNLKNSISNAKSRKINIQLKLIKKAISFLLKLREINQSHTVIFEVCAAA